MLPFLNAQEQSIDMVSQFGGLNKRLITAENEFADMNNMTAKHFPMIATRDKRGILKLNGEEKISNAIGVHAKDRLLVSYTKKGSSGISFPDGLSKATIDGEKQSDGVWTSRLKMSEDMAHTLKILISDGSGKMFIKKNSDKEELNYLYVYQNNTHIPLDFYDLDIFDIPSLIIKWSHPQINDTNEIGFFVGKVDRVSNDGTKVTYIDKDYLPIYNGLFNGQKAIFRIKDKWTDFKIEESNLDYQKKIIERTFTLKEPAADIARGDNVYVYISPEDFYMHGVNAQSEDSLYSKVKINAENEESVNRVIGNTLSYDGNDFKVVSVLKKDGEYEAKIERPHESIPKGYSLEEDRFWIGEVNLETGEMIPSNICPAATGKRHIVEMGAYLVVFPEKVRINTAERSLSGQYKSVENLEFTNKLVHSDASYSYRLVLHDGTVVDLDDKGVISVTSPQNPFDGQLWIDNSTMPYTFKRWSEQTCLWATFVPYCEFWGKGVSEEWAVGDAFEFDTVPDFIQPAEGQKYFVISEVGEKVDDNKESLGNFIRFPCSMTTARLCSSADGGNRILRRTVPDLDFVVESENRLWGCKYGEVDGEMVNEIFACKLGDPKNWHYFANTSMDSYFVSLGAEGAFTGAVTYKSNPLFFREDSVHRVSGNYPANYALKTYTVNGVAKGSEYSLVTMNDVLYYQSPNGVMAYTGAVPVNISEALGKEKLKDTVMGVLDNELYVSARDKNNNPVLYVYNSNYGTWHKQDNLNVKSLATYKNEIYALTQDGTLIALNGTSGDIEEDFEWSVESGKIGFSTPYRKFIFKINARLLMGLGARVRVMVQYDSSGVWEHITMIKPLNKVGSVAIPIMPRRCDHFSLKFSGTGEVKLLSLVKYTEEGSDI